MESKRLHQVQSMGKWAQMFLVLAAILLLKHPDQMLDLIVHGKMTLQETTRHHCDELQVCDITCIVHCMTIVTNSNFFEKQNFFNRMLWTLWTN